jgi:hypothetical protein
MPTRYSCGDWTTGRDAYGSDPIYSDNCGECFKRNPVSGFSAEEVYDAESNTMYSICNDCVAGRDEE